MSSFLRSNSKRRATSEEPADTPAKTQLETLVEKLTEDEASSEAQPSVSTSNVQDAKSPVHEDYSEDEPPKKSTKKSATFVQKRKKARVSKIESSSSESSSSSEDDEVMLVGYLVGKVRGLRSTDRALFKKIFRLVNSDVMKVFKKTNEGGPEFLFDLRETFEEVVQELKESKREYKKQREPYEAVKTVKKWLSNALEVPLNPYCDLPGYADHWRVFFTSEIGKECMGIDNSTRSAAAFKSMKATFKHMISRTPREMFSWRVKRRNSQAANPVRSYNNDRKGPNAGQGANGVRKDNPYAKNFKK